VVARNSLVVSKEKCRATLLGRQTRNKALASFFDYKSKYEIKNNQEKRENRVDGAERAVFEGDGFLEVASAKPRTSQRAGQVRH